MTHCEAVRKALVLETPFVSINFKREIMNACKNQLVVFFSPTSFTQSHSSDNTSLTSKASFSKMKREVTDACRQWLVACYDIQARQLQMLCSDLFCSKSHQQGSLPVQLNSDAHKRYPMQWCPPEPCLLFTFLYLINLLNCADV